MDEPARDWSAPVGAVVLGAVAAVGLGAWALVGADPAGSLLVGLAALVLAGGALVGALARPRLAARADGLVHRTLRGPHTWPWARVDAVRVVRLRRLGMPGSYVEVDARDADGRERLLVMGRLELGTDPVDVAAALQHHRARAARAGGPAGTRDSAQAAGGEGVADDGPEREVADPDGEQDDDHEAPGDGEARRGP